MISNSCHEENYSQFTSPLGRFNVGREIRLPWGGQQGGLQLETIKVVKLLRDLNDHFFIDGETWGQKGEMICSRPTAPQQQGRNQDSGFLILIPSTVGSPYPAAREQSRVFISSTAFREKVRKVSETGRGHRDPLEQSAALEPFLEANGNDSGDAEMTDIFMGPYLS